MVLSGKLVAAASMTNPVTDLPNPYSWPTRSAARANTTPTNATPVAISRKMIDVCSNCHSENFAISELEKGDEVIREADHLLAQAIRIVAGLYADGILEKPEGYSHSFPDLLTFHDAPTPIEQRLFEMHLSHRMRAFQGAFHANPDYSLWYGWSEMVRDLADIEETARNLRAQQAD